MQHQLNYSNKHNEYCYENNGSHLLLICHGDYDYPETENGAVGLVKSMYPICKNFSM